MLVRLISIVAILNSGLSWQTCDDFEFCSSIRNAEPGQSEFSVLEWHVSDSVEGKLIRDSEELSFKFSALPKGNFRLTIQDVTNSRFTPEDDVLIESGKIPLNVSKETEDQLLLVNAQNDLQVRFNLKPLQIDILKDDVVISRINKNNRLVLNSNEGNPSLALDVSFPNAKAAYGIPQHAEDLALPSTKPGGLNPQRLFNVDNPAYKTHVRESLYGAMPVLYGIGPNVTAGAFWMNAAQTFIDITEVEDDEGVETLFISESGALEVFILSGPTLKDCVRQYTNLTGVTNLPQYFTLGYHQSRYSYMSQAEVEEVVEKFDENNLPVDVVWLDIDYSNGYRYFTWNYTTFPDPIGMQHKLAGTGRKMVAISDPHIKVEKGYFVYDQGLQNDFFIKNPDGTVFEGDCWPGLSSYIDYFNPIAQDWYSNLYSLENFANSTLNLYIWNDMNEPSVFLDDYEKTMPPQSIHYGNIPHRDVHNMYGFKQTQSTYRGLLKRDGHRRRPFILSRSHFAGSQRYTAIWTGDNAATWEHLRISIPMVLTENLAGIVFCGADIGGFVGNVEDELYQRWYQTGLWHPFYRGHSDLNTTRREPYLYPEKIKGRIREVLRIRYRHIPYWYLLFFEHESTGDPVVRPLSYHYPLDEHLWKIQEQWLVGENIMAAPVLYEGATQVETVFPGDPIQAWFDLQTSRVYRGGTIATIEVDMDSTPFYYRSGSIILTIEDEVASTEGHRQALLSIRVFLDERLEAKGAYYWDDLETFDYRNGIFVYDELHYGNGRLNVRNLKGLRGHELRIMAINVYSVEEMNGGVGRVRMERSRSIGEVGEGIKIVLDEDL